MKALPDCRRANTGSDERLGHVVDVDGMQPDRLTTDRPEPSPQYGPKERDQMEIARAVDKAGSRDDRREAFLARGGHRQLCIGLCRLVDVRRAQRRALVGGPIARTAEDARCAAVHEPLESCVPPAALDQQFGSVDMRLAVFIGGLPGFQQLAGKVIHDRDVIERGVHRALVVQVADDDLHALSSQLFRLRLRANERAHAYPVENEAANKGSP